MAYQDNYLKYLEAVPGIVKRCSETGNRPVLAYTSNLDAIVKWNVDSFNSLLEKYLKDEPSFTEEETVDNMEDFARIVTYFAVNGLGGEVDITSGKVIEELETYFNMQHGLGGTCAQGAAALCAMGIPVIVHITDRSGEVLEFMDHKGMESVKDKKRVPLAHCASGKQPLIHLVMQYTKGDIIRANGKQYQIPLSNRLIMGYDEVHKIMPVEKDFLDYLEAHTEEMYSYDVSGFNLIVSFEALKERLAELAPHYQTIKEKNPDLKIYFESAHFISAKIREYLYDVLSRYMDIMGMNEEELVDLTKKKAHPVDKDDITSIISGLDYLLEMYPVKGIVMHSKDYALYYGETMEGTDLEMGLTLGNLMSATRARIGRYGTQADCRESLKLALSPTGVEFAEKISRMVLKHTAILVPSRYMEKPKFTIGLGDTFVAGMQMCFVK